MTRQLTKQAKQAVAKYGAAACVRAYQMHMQGEGAANIASQGPAAIRTARQADAAINAGREICRV